jgi:hypothetical protein
MRRTEAQAAAFEEFCARCRELDATLVSRNVTDLSRIAKVFVFAFGRPYPPPNPA